MLLIELIMDPFSHVISQLNEFGRLVFVAIAFAIGGFLLARTYKCQVLF